MWTAPLPGTLLPPAATAAAERWEAACPSPYHPLDQKNLMLTLLLPPPLPALHMRLPALAPGLPVVCSQRPLCLIWWLRPGRRSAVLLLR